MSETKLTLELKVFFFFLKPQGKDYPSVFDILVFVSDPSIL